MEHKDEVRALQLRELRGRMDRALGESDRGDGTDGDAVMREMLDDLDSRHRRHAG